MEQVPASDGSAYQEYVLTKKGRELFPVILALRQWGENFSGALVHDLQALLAATKEQSPFSQRHRNSGIGPLFITAHKSLS